MSQEEAIVSFLLITSIGLVAYGSYRALRFAKGHLRWIGILIPVVYLFGWLIVPFLGSEVSESEFQNQGAETPMAFASGVFVTSYLLMIAAAFAGILCIRFFVRPGDGDPATATDADSDVERKARAEKRGGK